MEKLIKRMDLLVKNTSKDTKVNIVTLTGKELNLIYLALYGFNKMSTMENVLDENMEIK